MRHSESVGGSSEEVETSLNPFTLVTREMTSGSGLGACPAGVDWACTVNKHGSNAKLTPTTERTNRHIVILLMRSTRSLMRRVFPQGVRWSTNGDVAKSGELG